MVLPKFWTCSSMMMMYYLQSLRHILEHWLQHCPLVQRSKVVTFKKKNFLPLILLSTSGLASDAEGLLPSALDARMQSPGYRPRVVYIIPTGQNPAGSTMSNTRKAEVRSMGERECFRFAKEKLVLVDLCIVSETQLAYHRRRSLLESALHI